MPAPIKIIHENWQRLADDLFPVLWQPVPLVTSRVLSDTKNTTVNVDMNSDLVKRFQHALLNDSKERRAVIFFMV